MKNKPITIKECQTEIERILKIYLYSKVDKDEEEMFKTELKNLIQAKGRIEHENFEKAQERRAERERKKYGIKIGDKQW